MLDALADTRTIICELRRELSRERELSNHLMRRLEGSPKDATKWHSGRQEDITRLSSANRELRYVVEQAESRIEIQQQEIIALREQLSALLARPECASQKFRDRTESSDSQFDYERASLTETPVLRTQPRFDVMETPQVKTNRYRSRSARSIQLPAHMLSPESVSESVFEDHTDVLAKGQQNWLGANEGLSLEDERFLSNVSIVSSGI